MAPTIPQATPCVQRISPLGGATFSQTAVFGVLGHPQTSLEEWTPTAAPLGVLIPLQAASAAQLCISSPAGSAALAVEKVM